MTTPATPLPIVNTHVHVPPNFSAYATPTDVIAEATAQGVRALGISNFYDQQVYRRFGEEATAAGIVPLYGLEFITADDDLAAAGSLVNDPANPGRVYLCGKGIDPFQRKSPQAARTAALIRSGNDQRAHAQVEALATHFASHEVPTDVTPTGLEAAVAARGDVPPAWVSLQERHIAGAFQEVVTALPPAEQMAALERLYGRTASADPADAGATQGEIRSKLLKSGGPGFVPEVPLDFADARAYVLAMDGIPCYPILADGAPALSAFEWPPSQLAANLKARGIYAAELIPVRNASAIVDAYVEALTAAGIIVMGGTEHNTPERIPLDPACSDGPLSPAARRAFYDGTCVVAAHQEAVAAGRPGYVDADGLVIGDAAVFAARGAQLIEA